MINLSIFADMAKYNPVVYLDSNMALDPRFVSEVYPALKDYNKSAKSEDRLRITVLPSCASQLKNRLDENRIGYDAEVAKRAENVLAIMRNDSDKGVNFIYCEDPRKSIFAMELFVRLCKDKLNTNVYVLTNNAKLRRDLSRFDLAECYIKNPNGPRYSSHNHMVRSIGYRETGEFAVIRPMVEEAQCDVKPDIFKVEEIDFAYLASNNIEVFVDCSFIANKGFEKFDRLLTEYNASSENKIKIRVTTPTALELDRLAFDESVNNSQYARYGREIIGRSFAMPWNGNYERVEGDGIDFFFDACFLSKCCSILTKKSVAILTHDKGLTRDCRIFNKMESFRCQKVISYDYDELGDVRSSEVGRFLELLLG